jgi:hypothetical protein
MRLEKEAAARKAPRGRQSPSGAGPGDGRAEQGCSCIVLIERFRGLELGYDDGLNQRLDRIVTHEPFSEWATLYAMGTLDGEERTHFETHLTTGCQSCTTILAELSHVMATLAWAAPAVSPRPELREENCWRGCTLRQRPRCLHRR